MEFSIKKCVAWAGDFESEQDWQQFAAGNKPLNQATQKPTLKQIPAMQRRRLSPFAKMALHCALEAGEGYLESVPSVFASRHGDLHKTSKLISDVAAKESLSPTQFGLSVHNAVGGQFSIFTGNKAPLSATSAGEDTFFSAIVDAVCKLHTNDYAQILVVYTDEVVPSIYQPYVAQEEVSIATALLIERPSQDRPTYSLKVSSNTAATAENPRMQVIDFLSFYYGTHINATVSSKRHIWSLSKQA